MTEKSYLWDGTVTGDASLAPYNSLEFGTWIFSHFLSNNLTEGYVIPGYLDDLWVRGAGAGNYGVVVNAGAACFNNYLYILDEAVSISLTRLTGAQYRRDLIILRANLNKNEIRLAVLEGQSGATLDVAEPTLTRSGGIYEIPLASVVVIGTTAWDNYNAFGATYIDDRYVVDNRKFIYNLFERKNYQGGSSNLLRNSEWLAQPDVTVGTCRPAEWINIAPPPGGTAVGGGTPVAVTEGSGRVFGHAIGGGQSMAQWIKVDAQVFTVKMAYTVSVVPDYRALIVRLRGFRKSGEESSVVRLVDHIPPTSVGELLFTVKFPEEDIDRICLDVYGGTVSQILVQPGYHVGEYRQIPEVIMFDTALADASWTATAKSSGTTTIDLAASFGPLIRNYTKAVILRLRGRDSGSAAAANCSLSALGYAVPFNASYGILEITGVTNDVWRETRAIVPVDQIYWGTGVAGAQFRLVVVATGAATFDATVEIVGVIL